ncbi:anti-sigma factor domain-containing protein [Paracoccus laeviglucosivorans]|uniref:Anti-sigma-K factor RskA n=1 Tax=Paracoccus laeviglucosivorans TaxID=1197861 RepID=A0A521ACG5_9RHOB|nr:anti-sigma factor [Paracoccus laeviglucosivorans]SMO32485.1 Anti-sigma-K factor RskA [Paracoccus laeviglucosivorans]
MSDARLIELDELIARAAQGDRPAFDGLYDLTSARLYALILSLLPNRPEAEDVLAQSFVAVWRQAGQYPASGLTPMAWLMTQARGQAVERLRARGEQLPEARVTSSDDDALAADFALAALAGDAATAAAARHDSDADFARRVRDSQEQLARNALALTPVMPPARARQRMREALGHAQPPFAEVLDARIRWWQRPLPLLGAIAVVIAVAAVLLVPLLRPASGKDYQTQIVSQPAGLRVDFSLNDRRMHVALQSGAAPVGRDWEIWWMPPGDAPPVSLGLVPQQEGEVSRDLPRTINPEDGVQIALSDEPEGGSPNGQATGPIMAISPLNLPNSP